MRRGFLLGLVVLVACSPTTLDTAPTVATVVAGTTVPSGTTAELLDRLLDEASALSERVVENEGDEAAGARIEALWTAVRPDIEAARPDLLAQFDAAVDYARRAVDRRRPADADKAASNLRTLTAELNS